MARPNGPLDMVGKIMKYEEGEMEPGEAREFFVELHNTRALRHLQGSYGREFQRYLNGGEITINGDGVAEAHDLED